MYSSFDDILLSRERFLRRKQLKDTLFSLPGNRNEQSSRRIITERRRRCESWTLIPVELAQLFPGQMQSRLTGTRLSNTWNILHVQHV